LPGFETKTLLFKTIGVQEAEKHSDFHLMLDDLTLVVADNR